MPAASQHACARATGACGEPAARAHATSSTKYMRGGTAHAQRWSRGRTPRRLTAACAEPHRAPHAWTPAPHGADRPRAHAGRRTPAAARLVRVRVDELARGDRAVGRRVRDGAPQPPRARLGLQRRSGGRSGLCAQKAARAQLSQARRILGLLRDGRQAGRHWPALALRWRGAVRRARGRPASPGLPPSTGANIPSRSASNPHASAPRRSLRMHVPLSATAAGWPAPARTRTSFDRDTILF